ncbi:glutathione S-transferase [Mycena belliarum]|uniref:glutathione transferase n=1 Tax=Mycena belliarum TaxID=1033014 RepID=A0AAD6XQZ4_9AGAR|nr:glutathione S-transferase [Mycena belliae]
MVLKLYSVRTAGGGCGLVAMTLVEKQLPFELVVVDMARGDHKTPAYLARHPFGQVPMLDDDGLVVYESRAICRYLAEKYADQGTPLVPTGIPAKALFEQAASIEVATFYPLVFKIAMEAVYNPQRSLPVDEAGLAQAKTALAAKLDVYEVILGTQKYLGGNVCLRHDVGSFPDHNRGVRQVEEIRQGEFLPAGGWWNDISSRPSWVQLQAEGIQSVR